MAIIKSAFEMDGSVRGVSFYKQSGSEKVIMRTKGGASKQKIRRSPKFEVLRQHQVEWSGCVYMSRSICSAMTYAIGLADYNVPAVLNGFSKKLQGLDTGNTVGERRIGLSAYRHLLEAFPLNKKHPFAGILQVMPTWTIHREILKAVVKIPYINTEMHLQNPYQHPWFRIICNLGIVSDMHCNTETKKYLADNELLNGFAKIVSTDWFSTNSIVKEQKLVLKYDESDCAQLTNKDSILLSIAVEFGKTGFSNQPVEIKHAGGAMILGVR